MHGNREKILAYSEEELNLVSDEMLVSDTLGSILGPYTHKLATWYDR